MTYCFNTGFRDLNGKVKAYEKQKDVDSHADFIGFFLFDRINCLRWFKPEIKNLFHSVLI